MHFCAPEYGTIMGPAIDIYSFGMCALEMAALEIQGNGDSGNLVTDENINRTIDSLDDTHQKDFIRLCLNKNPTKRPTARELLFHPLLFEVHSLKLLAAHALVKSAANISETVSDESLQKFYGSETVIAEIQYKNQHHPPVQTRVVDVPVSEKLEKFIEDVKNGIYPLTAFGAKQPPPARSRAISPEMAVSEKSVTPEPMDVEARKIVTMICLKKRVDVKTTKEENEETTLTIVLRMDDKMNRELTTTLSTTDTPAALAHDLVHYGFINESDQVKVSTAIEESILNGSGHSSPTHNFSYLPAGAAAAATVAAAVAAQQQPPPPLCQLSSTPSSLVTAVTSTPTQVPMHSTS